MSKDARNQDGKHPQDSSENTKKSLSDVRYVRNVRHSDKTDISDNGQQLIDIFPDATAKDRIEFALFPDNELNSLEIAEHVAEDDPKAWRKNHFYKLRSRLAEHGRGLDQRKKNGEILYSLSEKRRLELEQEIADALDQQQRQDYATRQVEKLHAERMRKLSAQEVIDEWRTIFDEREPARFLEAVNSDAEDFWLEFSLITESSPELADALLEEPEHTLKAAQIAAEQSAGASQDFTVRVTGLPTSSEYFGRQLRAEQLSTFVSVEGMVSSRVPARPLVVWSRFECPSCGEIIDVIQAGKKYRRPTGCGGCGRKGKFQLLFEKKTDVVYVKLEETPDQLSAEQQPRSTRVKITGTLADEHYEDRLNPGGRVRVVGEYRDLPRTVQGGAQSVEFDTIILANSLVFPEDSEQNIKLTDEDIASFEEFAQRAQKDLDAAVGDLVASFAPHIVGQELAKRAIIVQQHTSPNRHGDSFSRNMAHVMLVGDPGMGKSQLGRFAAEVMPRSRYASAEGSTGVGLTAAVTRDDFSDEWQVVGGVMSMSNGGLAVIDELDKAAEDDLNKLHTVLEDGEIVLDKATIHTRIPAHTRVLALLNPMHTRFDQHKELNEQIPGLASMLNRFDLIVAQRDNSTELDSQIFDAVIEKRRDGATDAPYSREWLRKKLAYVHEHAGELPISDEAKSYMREQYTKIRSSMQGAAGKVPLNTRAAEAWYRLSLAVANLRHAWLTDKEVSLADSQLAMQLWFETTGQVIGGPDGFDVDIVEGLSYRTRQHRETILQLVRSLDDGEGTAFSDIAQECNLSEQRIEQLLDEMDSDREVLQHKPGRWKVL